MTPEQRDEQIRAPFRKQVLRFSAMQYFPALDPGVTELIDCLIRVSKGDPERARRIADQAIRSAPNSPSPAELESYASELGVDAPRGCEHCEGTGMRYVPKRCERTTLDGDGKPYVYESYVADCQQRCDCALGQFLRAKDKEAAAAQRKQREPNPVTTVLGSRRASGSSNSQRGQ